MTPGWRMVEPFPGCGRLEKAGSPLCSLPSILCPVGLIPRDVSSGLPHPVASGGTWPWAALAKMRGWEQGTEMFSVPCRLTQLRALSCHTVWVP